MSDDNTTVLRLNVNDVLHTVVTPGHHTLLEVLREECGLTGTKHGCELGECGTCTVLLDGRPVLSCLALASDAVGRRVQTVEGLQQGNRLHPLQAAFADLGAAQCGYCTPGILLVAHALLAANPRPDRPQIEEALAGNLCRCTGYQKILEAVEGAAAVLRGEDWTPAAETLYGSPLPATAAVVAAGTEGGGGRLRLSPGAPGAPALARGVQGGQGQAHGPSQGQSKD